MIGYLVKDGSSYLEYHPGPRSFEFTSGETRYATVFPKAEADAHADAYRRNGHPSVIVVGDLVRQREPDRSVPSIRSQQRKAG